MSEYTIPNQKIVEKAIKSVFELLFPTTHSFTEAEIESNKNDLEKQISAILSGLTENNEEVTRIFFDNLDKIKKRVAQGCAFYSRF